MRSSGNKAELLYGEYLTEDFKNTMIKTFTETKGVLEKRLKHLVKVDTGSVSERDVINDIYDSIVWYSTKIEEFKSAKFYTGSKE